MGSKEIVSVWDKNINSWISEVKQFEWTMKNEQIQNGRGKYQTDEIAYTKSGDSVNGWESQTLKLKPKFSTSQIWTLINNFVIVLVCAKCSKLSTVVENIIIVQQLPSCLPSFFAFSSEVLNSVIKSCFERVAFQDAVCEEFFSIHLWCLQL